jgi:hypothetical protein
MLRQFHSSGGKLLGSNRGGLGFEPASDHVEFVVDKVAMGQVFSTLISHVDSHSTDCSTRRHPGAGTMGQIVVDVPRGLSLNLPPPKKLPYILESNPHLVFATFLNEKKLVHASSPHLSFNRPLPV